MCGNDHIIIVATTLLAYTIGIKIAAPGGHSAFYSILPTVYIVVIGTICAAVTMADKFCTCCNGKHTLLVLKITKAWKLS